MTYSPVDVLKVSAWGHLVGYLAPGGSRAYAFEYDPTWRQHGIELAPILMPLRPSRPVFQFPHLPAETFHGLPPTFADSAPDRFGNAIITAALQREGVDVSRVSFLDRLAYVGRRGMGALTFEPDLGPVSHSPTPVELSELVEAARGALVGTLEPGEARTAAMAQLVQVGTSAGGARAKAVIAWDRASNEMRAGNLPVPDRFEQWLLKLDGVEDVTLGGSRGFGRVEYAYHAMAVHAGVTMSECRLLEEGGRAHFMTKRFDRSGPGQRLHVQSLCGLAAIDFNAVGVNDYGSLFDAVGRLDLGDDALAQTFRRMVFNVLASNNDDHAKNFAFLMDAEGTWSLAPAYDLTYSYSPSSHWVSRHLTSVNGKFDGITERDMMDVATRFGVPGARAIIRDVEDAVARWPEFARASDVRPDLAGEIASRLHTVAEAARSARRRNVDHGSATPKSAPAHET